jgi:hypothetical protein
LKQVTLKKFECLIILKKNSAANICQSAAIFFSLLATFFSLLATFVSLLPTFVWCQHSWRQDFPPPAVKVYLATHHSPPASSATGLAPSPPLT